MRRSRSKSDQSSIVPVFLGGINVGSGTTLVLMSLAILQPGHATRVFTDIDR